MADSALYLHTMQRRFLWEGETAGSASPLFFGGGNHCGFDFGLDFGLESGVERTACKESALLFLGGGGQGFGFGFDF